MKNPLNSLMLSAMLKQTQEQSKELSRELGEALQMMLDAEDPTERLVSMQMESVFMILTEYRLLKEFINGGVSIVETFISDIEGEASEKAKEGSSILGIIKDFRESIDSCTPHSDMLVKNLLPEIKKAMKDS